VGVRSNILGVAVIFCSYDAWDTPYEAEMNTMRRQLNFEEAKKVLWREMSNKKSNVFRYIYLFGFDNEDKLIWGEVVLPDDHPHAFERVISLAKLLNSENEEIYFMFKVKEYKFVDMQQEFEAYIEGFIDMRGTMERVRGFIKGWKEFGEKQGDDNLALKRYTIEFVNEKLGLPLKYSEKQRILDMAELLKS
jgi:hypothetical protein